MNNTEKTKKVSDILRKELTATGMKLLLYRDGTNTIALLVDKADNRVEARGVAIHSPDDQFDRKFGNNQAIGRALKAYRCKATGSPIMPFDHGTLGDGTPAPEYARKSHLVKPWNDFGYKRAYRPTLTDFEKTLLTKAAGA